MTSHIHVIFCISHSSHLFSTECRFQSRLQHHCLQAHLKCDFFISLYACARARVCVCMCVCVCVCMSVDMPKNHRKYDFWAATQFFIKTPIPTILTLRFTFFFNISVDPVLRCCHRPVVFEATNLVLTRRTQSRTFSFLANWMTRLWWLKSAGALPTKNIPFLWSVIKLTWQLICKFSVDMEAIGRLLAVNGFTSNVDMINATCKQVLPNVQFWFQMQSKRKSLTF